MRKLLLLFVVLTMGTVVANAQSLVINKTEGNPVELNLDNLKKVSFSDGNLVATFNDGTNDSYPLSEVSRLVFSGTTGVGVVEAMDGKLAYSAGRGLAVIANSQGSKLMVYNLSGSLVLQKVISSQVETVDLNGLQKGLYLLKLEGKTIKIVR